MQAIAALVGIWKLSNALRDSKLHDSGSYQLLQASFASDSGYKLTNGYAGLLGD